jgi:hypothetical protein
MISHTQPSLRLRIFLFIYIHSCTKRTRQYSPPNSWQLVEAMEDYRPIGEKKRMNCSHSISTTCLSESEGALGTRAVALCGFMMEWL